MRIILPDQVLPFSTQGFLGVLHVKEKIAEWVFSTVGFNIDLIQY